MNIENMKKLRAFVAKLPDQQLDMKRWHSTKDCGTVCCIGGWATVLALEEIDPTHHYYCTDLNCAVHHAEFAADWLDLDDDETQRLFFDFPDMSVEYNWKPWILARLDGVIARKKVVRYKNDWRISSLRDVDAVR